MITKPETGPPSAAAISRWENEGGALKRLSGAQSGGTEPLADTQRHILQCLGAALVMMWNDLPTDMQRLLFRDAVTASHGLDAIRLKAEIARFLHDHKDDSISS